MGSSWSLMLKTLTMLTTHEGAKGFRVALTNALDQAVINQDGFYIAPGKGSFTWMLCCKTCHSAVQFYNQGKLSNKD